MIPINDLYLILFYFQIKNLIFFAWCGNYGVVIKYMNWI
jgi:hypothetical protein